jgi:hypothetical protein
VLLWGLAAAAVLVLLVAVRVFYAFRDRHPGFRIELSIKDAPSPPPVLRAGFGRVAINPSLGDPRRPVWLAGFSNHRAATSQHDDLQAIACVLDDGRTRIAIAVFDAIGFFHDDVLEVRQQLPADWRLDYTVVCSTHNHSTPDLMGLWGKSPFQTGVDPQYRQQVIAGAVKALGEAVASLQPASLTLGEIPTPPAGLVADTRNPQVFDSEIRVMLLRRTPDGSTLGSIVTWANHPEVLWGGNKEITADYCGYLRDALEKGVSEGTQTPAAGWGGVHLYINGAIGGLMTPHPSLAIQDPLTGQSLSQPSHDKARALGRNIALRVLRHFAAAAPAPEARPRIVLEARTLELPVGNPLFMLAPVVGVIDRGQPRWAKMRTEMALIAVGGASILTLPGEMYPEIVNGGIESPPGADFGGAPLEVPPLRDFMPGRVKFVFGLANDEIGYIIPKSEWDRKPPYLYHRPKGVYGEVNSLGPETAPLLHQAARELARRLAAPGS